MHLHLAVGGLLARNAAVTTLLMNYADRLERGPGREGVATAPCFIIPTWSIDEPPRTPFRRHLLTVQAHTARTDPCPDAQLDSILQLLHVVLTDDHASSWIIARRLGAPAGPAHSRFGTAVRTGTWEIAPAPSSAPGADRRRLRPWPDCRTALTTGAVACGTTALN
jgi:hypothetical protein